MNALKPRIEIHAYAGPMEKDEAEEFRKVWKRAPRTLKFSSPSNASNHDISNLRFRDMDKGLERLGKTLANKYKVEWREFWPFLDSFADISTDEGLALFEKYLAYRTNVEYSGSRSPVSPKDVSSDGRASSNNLSDLCRAFQDFNLSEGEDDGIDCSSQVLNPFLYVEKSCRVFANRIAQPVLNLLETEQNSITQTLKSEVKHLEQSMMSYMDDVRFVSVNFNVVHSRLGSLISSRLKDLVREDDCVSLRRKIEVLLERCNKHLDYFSSDDESMNHKNQVLVLKKSTSTNKQVVCLLRCILDGFCSSDAALGDLSTEVECLAAWKEAKPCECVWQTRGNKKGSSLSRNSSMRHSARRFRNHKNSSVRKLTFDEDRFKCDSPPQQISDGSNKEVSSSSDDEEFFTPPASPSLLRVSDDEDIFDDSQLPDKDVFIEGYGVFFLNVVSSAKIVRKNL